MPRTSRTPITDEDLEDDARTRQHERKQRILDALATIAVFAIYAIPVVLAVLYTTVLIHKGYIMGDWQGLGDDVRSMLIPVLAYLAGKLDDTELFSKRK